MHVATTSSITIDRLNWNSCYATTLTSKMVFLMIYFLYWHTQTAIPVPQVVDEMVNGICGERVTLQCPYRPGNYLSAYEVEWTVMIGGTTTVINVTEPFSLNQTDFSLSLELNPTSVGTYLCHVTIMSFSPAYNNHKFSGLSINGMLTIYSSVFLIKKVNECCLPCLCNI